MSGCGDFPSPGDFAYETIDGVPVLRARSQGMEAAFMGAALTTDGERDWGAYDTFRTERVEALEAAARRVVEAGGPQLADAIKALAVALEIPR